MQTKVINTGYEPRLHQVEIHKSLKRFNVICAHRRFGKTVCVLHHMLDAALRNQRKNPVYAFVSPTFAQSKRICWQYLLDATQDIPGREVNIAELRISIYRAGSGDKITIYLLSAENPDSIRGMYLDGVVLDEYAHMSPLIWTQVIRPALSDRKGWVIFISTPCGNNHFKDIYDMAMLNDSWYCVTFKSSETGILDDEELQAARDTMSEEDFLQEMECSFTAALIGAYYGKEMSAALEEKRITNVPYDKALPVDTYWDLGMDDCTSIWLIQSLRDRQHSIIRYIENSGAGLDWYVKELMKNDYVWGDHVLPHDAAVRELGTGVSRQQTLRDLQLAKTRILPRQGFEDGIHAVRQIFNKCYFDETNCAKGIDALRNYQKKWDPKTKIFQPKPKRDWSTHGADAFRTFGMGFIDGVRRANKHLPRQAELDYNEFG